ncbi:MAG: outer membrane lipoprotein LolB [Gammaproteobacteria bacterium]|nr:outer membrane lipoprotein LolB [Gammaproteobacteria bacterium]
MLLRIVLLCVLLLLMAACTSWQGRGGVPALAPPDPDLPWRLTGRMTLGDGRETWHLGVDWLQHGEYYQLLLLTAPLGRKVAEARGDLRRMELALPDQPAPLLGEPEQVLQQYLGWPLPLAELRYWLRGLPAPGSEAAGLARDPSGRVIHFVQRGWSADYRWPAGAAVPDRLFLQSGPLQMRLVVDRWDAAPELLEVTDGAQ